MPSLGWIVFGGGGHLRLELLLHGRVLVDEGRLRLGDLDLLARDGGLADDRDPLRLDSPHLEVVTSAVTAASGTTAASLLRPRGGAPLGRRGQRRASGWA